MTDGILPARRDLLQRAIQAALVGATIYVLDGSPTYAAATAGLFAGLSVLAAVSQTVVGDDADNALFGVLALGGAASVGASAPLLGAGAALVGGWLLVDGVQHLRHDVSRDEFAVRDGHDGGPASGFARAMVDRLLEPFRL
ncbi:MAG: hypothetical protein ABEJ08_03825 [Halobacteriaceae archaeon]